MVRSSHTNYKIWVINSFEINDMAKNENRKLKPQEKFHWNLTVQTSEGKGCLETDLWILDMAYKFSEGLQRVK